MQIRTEFAGCSLPFHGSYDFSIHNKATDVRSASFFNKLLNKNICIQTSKRLNNSFGGLFRFGKNNTYSLSALD